MGLALMLVLCFATGALSCITTQVETRADEFNVLPAQQVVRVNGQTTFTCAYTRNPGLTRSWAFSGNGDCVQIRPNVSDSGWYLSADGNSLIINQAQRKHQGNYFCYVFVLQTERVISESVTLDIYDEAFIVIKDKQPTVITHNYTLDVGNSATLNITTTGTPLPELRLLHNSGSGYVTVTDLRFTVVFGNIVISLVEPEDTGSYRLQATQQISTTEHYTIELDFIITVIIPQTKPVVLLLDTNGQELESEIFEAIGNDIDIACCMASPFTENLSIEWNNHEQEVTVNSFLKTTLHIRNAQRADSNTYLCIVTNSVGPTFATVSVQIGPVPEQYIVSFSACDGCLEFSWRPSENSQISVDNFYVQYRLDDNSSADPVFLTFRSTEQSTKLTTLPAGKYGVIVWASNKFGNSTASEEQFFTIPDLSTAAPINNSNDDNGALIGVVAAVCVLFVILFIIVVVVLMVVFLHTKRSQAQQQWCKDPEFQSQLSLSQQSMRVPPSEAPSGPTYALPIIPNGNQHSSSSITKRYSEETTWQIPRDNVQLSELLAEGEHTVLYRATAFGVGKFKKSMEVTVKQVQDNNSSPEEVKVLIEEMDLMSDLGIHPNIVNVLAVCTVGDPVYLIMDYFPYGDLLGFLRATRGHTDHYTVSAGTENKVPNCTVQSQDLLSIASQVASGMSFLEEKKVSHRSLCARNVLVGSGMQVKIYNYGQKNDDQGSYAKWMAPETLFDGTANTTSDAWSFGVTFWEVVTIGGSPYFEMRPEDMRKVLEDGYRMPNPDHCSEEIYKVMQDCWEYDPQDRPSFDLINYRLDTLTKSKLNYIDLKLYDEVLYSQFDDTPQLCTAL